MSLKLGYLRTIAQTNAQHTGAIIFLHGSGDTGPGIEEWIKLVFGRQFTFPHLKVVYPTAPRRPYTPMGGEPSNVWFNRKDIRPDVPDYIDDINATCKLLETFIKEQVCKDIPVERTILGGFSMGGAMALHMAFRFLPNVAGVFALSSFLNDGSQVYEAASSKRNIPLFMCHGDSDSLVPAEWGRETFNKLRMAGVDGQFHVIKNTTHDMKKTEFDRLHEWISQVLP